jgi:hypothetical protein
MTRLIAAQLVKLSRAWHVHVLWAVSLAVVIAFWVAWTFPHVSVGVYDAAMLNPVSACLVLTAGLVSTIGVLIVAPVVGAWIGGQDLTDGTAAAEILAAGRLRVASAKAAVLAIVSLVYVFSIGVVVLLLSLAHGQPIDPARLPRLLEVALLVSATMWAGALLGMLLTMLFRSHVAGLLVTLAVLLGPSVLQFWFMHYLDWASPLHYAMAPLVRLAPELARSPNVLVNALPDLSGWWLLAYIAGCFVAITALTRLDVRGSAGARA